MASDSRTSSVGDAWSGPEWGPWLPLRGAGRNREITAAPGLYRIRRIGRVDLDYIGQTGHGLRARLGHLGGVYGDAMPFNDPHTAGPGLWALRQSTRCEFECSVAPLDADAPTRKGLEALAVSVHRIRYQRSPTLNFGRMPAGWNKSSGNNARLVAAGKRVRGGPDPTRRRVPDAPPPRTLSDEVIALGWLGHDWTDWAPTIPTPPPNGLYRARRIDAPDLLYIGQGRIRDRIRSHLAKASQVGHPQQKHFGDEPLWSCTAVEHGHPTQLLELENDLIASHVCTTGHPPRAQFFG
jgi:hypothetical protein